MSMLVEYLHEAHTPEAKDGKPLQASAHIYDLPVVFAAA